MKAILLKKKKESKVTNEEYVVFDDLIKGVIGVDFYVPTFTGSESGLKFNLLSFLIDNYLFPKKENKHEIMILVFLKGYDFKLFKTIEFYKDDSFEI